VRGDTAERGISYPERCWSHLRSFDKGCRRHYTWCTRVVAHPEHRYPNHVVVRRCISPDLGLRSAVVDARTSSSCSLVSVAVIAHPVRSGHFYIPDRWVLDMSPSRPAYAPRCRGRLADDVRNDQTLRVDTLPRTMYLIVLDAATCCDAQQGHTTRHRHDRFGNKLRRPGTCPECRGNFPSPS